MAGGKSGKLVVLGLFALVLAAGGLLVWATVWVQGKGPSAPAPRMPRPIAAAALPPGEGGALLQRHCASCHALPDPAQLPAAAWPGVLADMERRLHTRIMRSSPIPTRTEWETLEAWLQRHAADATPLALDTDGSHP